MSTRRLTRKQQVIEKYNQVMGKSVVQAQSVSLPRNKTCFFCSEEKPIAQFSTLPRWGGYGATVDIACTRCWWIVFLFYRAEYHPDGVLYVPKDSEESRPLMDRVRHSLRGWMGNEKVIKRYSPLGELEDQVKPFRDFLIDLRDKGFALASFRPGELEEEVNEISAGKVVLVRAKWQLKEVLNGGGDLTSDGGKGCQLN